MRKTLFVNLVRETGCTYELERFIWKKPNGLKVGDVHFTKRPENDDEIILMAVEIAKSLAQKLPTEQDVICLL
jgi:hypothetical protein